MRSNKYINPQGEPVGTRPAATILLLRDQPNGQFEVLMTKRSDNASFAPGVYVFPGGTVDASDTQASEVKTYAMAAIREAFEELGVLLAKDSSGAYVKQELLSAISRSPSGGFSKELAHYGLLPAIDDVLWMCHWITDRDLPKRFDARFYVARMPPHQQPIADETEQFEPTWISPIQALDRCAAGTFQMIFPTIRTLEHLKRFTTVNEVLQACAGDVPIFTSCPRGGLVKGKDVRYMEHESPYGELHLVSPDGKIVHNLDWQYEHPVRLTKNVKRLTCSNAGLMTGPGTNTYIVGEPGNYAVIDPGPNDSEHIAKIAQSVGDQLKYILCTHSHPDHSPGAAKLKALTGGIAPIIGLASRATAKQHSLFVPDREFIENETFSIGDSTLRIVFTPGHAANHVCIELIEDKLLFSGDHILNGSTTIVDPPDGNMNDYIASLDRLAQLDVEYILPAHGYVLGEAIKAITHLKAHRLKREAKVIKAMRLQPGGTHEEWVKVAYDDTPEKLHGIALRSLLAHVERIKLLEMA